VETSHYVQAVVRYWWLILLTVVAGGVGGFVVYDHAVPMYKSTIRVIVATNASGSAIDEVTLQALAAQRATNFAHIAPTPPAVADAERQAGYPNEAVSVTASANGTDPFITISVDGRHPARLQAIASAYVDTLPGTVARLEAHPAVPVHLTVLSPAQRPSSPYSPNRNRDVGLGLAAGLIFGIAIALLREALNRTVRGSDELQQLTGLRLLGTVPRHAPKTRLPALTDPRGPRAEAYRQIRTTILNHETPLHTIAITSAAQGEGKTSVATNVAAVFSRAGHRVAIVDADLRRPQVGPFFDSNASVGLTQVLAGSATLDEAVNILENGRLAVLPSGRIPANPSEALGSVAMEQVLARLAAEYEYVFIDTPPALPVTDAMVIAPKVDGVVIVARLGRTSRQRIRHTTAAVDRVNATIIGIVANHAGKGTDSDYRYPYRYAGKRRKGDAAPTAISPAQLLGRQDVPDAPPAAQPEPAPAPVAPVTEHVPEPVVVGEPIAEHRGEDESGTPVQVDAHAETALAAAWAVETTGEIHRVVVAPSSDETAGEVQPVEATEAPAEAPPPEPARDENENGWHDLFEDTGFWSETRGDPTEH
jgi:polysaccharide biosynthesis transport protein